MTTETRNELKTWAQYFSIALIAELGAAFGWLAEQYGESDSVFNVFIMLFDHERQRLLPWCLIFVILSIARFLIRRYAKYLKQDWIDASRGRNASK